MKSFFLPILISMLLFSCSSDDNSPADDDINTGQTHRYTFTVTGNGLSDVSFTKEIPFDDFGGGLSYFQPENDYTMVSVYLNNYEPGIYAKYVYLDDIIQPLAINEFNNQDTSTMSVFFTHQGEGFSLESESGTCVSHFVETFPFGVANSGKSSFKIGFSGTFRRVFNSSDTSTYQVVGEIEVYNN